MAFKKVAVDGCSLDKSEASITSSASTDVSIEGHGVFFGKLGISISGSSGDNGKITDKNGAGSGNIDGSGKYMTDSSGNYALVEGDSVKIDVKGTSTKGGSSSSASDTVTVKISSAGQSSVTTEA